MKAQDKIHGERIIAVCRPTFLASIPALLFVALVALAVAIVSPTFAVMIAFAGFTIVGVRAFLRCIGAKYTFSNLRVSAQKGLLSIQTSEVRIADIRHVAVRKPLLGRVLGYSSAGIGTAGTAGVEIYVADVRGLDAILSEVDALRSAPAQQPAASAIAPAQSNIVYDAKTHQYVKA